MVKLSETKPGMGIDHLVEEDRVHRRVYVDPDVFDLEMESLWGRSWIYVGHESQVPNAGDFFTTTIAAQPVILVRQKDGELKVLYNRCAHKGAQLTVERTGNVKAFRCLYHAWVFGTDGRLKSRPKESGYVGTRLPKDSDNVHVRQVPRVGSYRGFVFASLAEKGPDLVTWLDVAASSIDNMVDRSPEGEVEVTGGVLRYMHNCNWKMMLENISDNMHAPVTHQSAYQPAQRHAKNHAGNDRPIAFDMLLPFGSSFEFFDESGMTTGRYGHSYSGGDVSIHSEYPEDSDYMAAMEAQHGADEAKKILAVNRHNTIIYPSVSIKCALQTIRVYRPIAVDKTLQETWTLRLKGAPEEMLHRSILYNRLIFSPGSVAGHDDYEAYQRMMAGLSSDGGEWVNLHRLKGAGEDQADGTHRAPGTSEIIFRHEYRTWAKYMAGGNPE